MPIWEIESPEGQLFEIEGDTPPTEEELEELFAPEPIAPIAQPQFPTLPERATLADVLRQPPQLLATEPGPIAPFPTNLAPPQEILPPTLPSRDLSAFEMGVPPLPEPERAEPLITLPELPEFIKKSVSAPTRLIAGDEVADLQEAAADELWNAAKSVPEFFTTEEGMLSLLASLTPVGKAGVTAYFTYDMAKSLMDQAKEMGGKWDEMSLEEKVRGLTRGLSTAGFATMLGKSAVGEALTGARTAREYLRKPVPQEVPPVIPTAIPTEVATAIPEPAKPEAAPAKVAEAALAAPLPRPELPNASELLRMPDADATAAIKGRYSRDYVVRLAREMTPEQLSEAEPLVRDHLQRQAEIKERVDRGEISQQQYIDQILETNKGKALVDVFQYLERELPKPTEAKAPETRILNRDYGAVSKGATVELTGKRGIGLLQGEVEIVLPDGTKANLPEQWLSRSIEGKLESLPSIVKRLGRQKVEELVGEWDFSARLSEDGKSIVTFADPRNQTGKVRASSKEFSQWLKDQEAASAEAAAKAPEAKPAEPAAPAEAAAAPAAVVEPAPSIPVGIGKSIPADVVQTALRKEDIQHPVVQNALQQTAGPNILAAPIEPVPVAAAKADMPRINVRFGESHRQYKRQKEAFKNAGIELRDMGSYTLGSKAQMGIMPDTPEARALAKKMGMTISRIQYGRSREAMAAGIVRSGEMTSKPMAEPVLLAELNKRYGVKPGGAVEMVFDESKTAMGWTTFDNVEGKPIRIVINRARIATPGDVYWVMQHEGAHWFDLSNPGTITKVLEKLTPKERNAVEAHIAANYNPTDFRVERVAYSVQRLADAWKDRGWFTQIVGKVMAFANETLKIKLTRTAAERMAALAVARGIEGAKAARVEAKPAAPIEAAARGVRERQEEPPEITQARTVVAEYEGGRLSAKDYGRYRRAQDMVSRYDAEAVSAGVAGAVAGIKPEGEFGELDGWATRSKEALKRVKEFFTPPEAGALPEVEIQREAILPRLPKYEVEKQIASNPQGMARVPGLGALMDPRATAKEPADAAFLARANSISKGNTFASMWAQSQWRAKDLFAVEKATGTFELTNGKRGYLSDVIEAEMRNPGSQALTDAQRNWIETEWKPALREVNQMLNEEGVTKVVTEEMEFDPATDYFPRPAIGKRNRPTTGTGGKPGGKPGAKQFFQKSRKFPSEEEGARPGTPESPKEEIIYDPDPISRASKFISGAYRSVADHRLAKDLSLGAGTVPDNWGIGRQVYAGPAFAGKIYPVDVAAKIERQFAQEVRGWVRNASTVTGAAKALMATADMSAPMIQGAAMFGRHPMRWAKAMVNSYSALTDPNVMGKLMENPRYKAAAEGFSQSGGSLLHLPEFLSGMAERQPATRIPGYGRLLTATGRAYGAFLDLAKLELFDAWSKTTPKAEWPRLAETIENSLFMGRMEQIALNPHRAIGERLIAFAPSYYRGAAGLISTAFQRGASGKMARQMLGSYATASALVTIGSLLALGEDWDSIRKRLIPGSGKFMKVPLSLGDGNRIEVGIGNILTQLVNLAEAARQYHTTDKPIDTGVEANPYLRFIRGRAAFLPSIGIELATGRDYFGQRITAAEATARRFAPFVLQAMFPRDKSALSQRLGDAAFTFFGLNAYPESEYQKALNQIDGMAQRIGGKSYSDLNISQRSRVIKAHRKQPEYRKYEPTPTDMERIILLNEQRRMELTKQLGEEASKKLAGLGLRLPQYRTTLRYEGADVPLTEKERQRYAELLAAGYQNRILRLNESFVMGKPQAERDKWWSERAAEIAAKARERLQREINKQKVK